MRAIRLRIRTLMLAVGVSAVMAACVVGIIRLQRAAAYYQSQAAVHQSLRRQLVLVVAAQERAVKAQPFSANLLRGLVLHRDKVAYHELQAGRYAMAARSPWMGKPDEPSEPSFANLPAKFADEVIVESNKRKIPWLDVSRCGATDSSLASLRESAYLRSLDLSSNRFTDAGLAHLAPLVDLEVLILEDNPITDAGLTHLDGLKNLRQLNVSRTQITRAGLDRLTTALPTLKITHDTALLSVQ